MSTTLKVLLIGEGGVGKSTFVQKCIAENELL
jgi:GTPase SAR1 family protein